MFSFLKKGCLLLLIIVVVFYMIFVYISASEEMNYLIGEAIKLINQRSYDAAITMLKRALEIDKNSDYTYFLMGEAYHYQGKYEEAIINYKRAIDLNPDVGEAYYNIAIAYYSLGNKDMCIKWLDRAKSLYYKNNQSKRYQKTLEKLINLTEGEAYYSYQEELKFFLSGGFPTPPPPSPRPTVSPAFEMLTGSKLSPEAPYPLRINEEPFNGEVIFDRDLKKLYVPAEEFLRKIGLKGSYDFYQGQFVINSVVFPEEFLRMDKYCGIYLSVIDSLDFLRISYVYNEVLGKPVVIVKPEGLNFDPANYALTPRPSPSPSTGVDTYINYDLTPFPTPNW